jgi:rfaE bifunctional protein nucleotidyltransferase chain/domain
VSESVSRKIVTADALAGIAAKLREAGRTIVQCHGCFDIVHPGHIRYLQFARQLGDVLIVSLTGDALIDKAPDRPLIPQELRAENLAALEFVDHVVIDGHTTACEILERVRPHVYVKGREYAGSADPRFVRERETVERCGGRVVFSSGDVVFSSTRLIETIGGDRRLDQDRVAALCARYHIDEPALCDTLEAFSGLRAVVVGDLVAERYIFCDASEVAADAPVMSMQQLGERRYWGGAAAVALQLAALGIRPLLFSRIGADAVSETLSEALAELSLETHLLRDRPDCVERTTYVADDAKMFVVTRGVSAPLDSSAERQALASLKERIADADLLIWCDDGFGMLTPGLVAGACDAARRGDILMAGHAPGQRGQLHLLRRLDLVSVTERRLREAMHDMGSGLSAVAWNLLNGTQTRALVVSLHKRGLICFDRRGNSPDSEQWGERLRSEFVPASAGRFVDALGAAEASLAVAAACRAAGRPLELATYLAAAAESLSAARIGGGAIGAETLRQWIAQQRELLPASRFVPENDPDLEAGIAAAANAKTVTTASASQFVATESLAEEPATQKATCS